jgi:hypothetical protein
LAASHGRLEVADRLGRVLLPQRLGQREVRPEVAGVLLLHLPQERDGVAAEVLQLLPERDQ